METLQNLTGARKKRLKDGIWAGNEGLVYELFDDSLHVIDPFKIPQDWIYIIVVDWGYRDPMVVHWWAYKGEKSILYREIYESGKSIESIAREAGKLSKGEKISLAMADHDPQKIITFRKSFEETYRKNLRMIKAPSKAIELGIQDVEKALKPDGEGIPGIRIFRDALVRKDPLLKKLNIPASTIEEYSAYIWPEDQDGKPRREIPVDKFNHGMDCTRYLHRYLARLQRIQNRPKARVI